MEVFAVVLGLLLATLIFVSAARELSRRRPHGRGQLIGFGTSAAVGLYGLVAFFAQDLAAFGGLPFIPPSLEWPVGQADQVVEASNGHQVVAVVPVGRVQVYDAQGRFLRGWFVPASGGAFSIAIGAGDEVEVITARRPRKLVYSLGGDLRQETTSSEYFDRRSASSAGGRWFGFPWTLWPFAGPLAAWVTGLVGMLGVAAFGERRGPCT